MDDLRYLFTDQSNASGKCLRSALSCVADRAYRTNLHRLFDSPPAGLAYMQVPVVRVMTRPVGCKGSFLRACVPANGESCHQFQGIFIPSLGHSLRFESFDSFIWMRRQEIKVCSKSLRIRFGIWGLEEYRGSRITELTLPYLPL